MRGPSRRRALGSRLLRQDKTGPEHQGLRYRQPENRLWLRRGRADLDLDLGDGGYDVRGADLFVRPLRALLVYGLAVIAAIPFVRKIRDLMPEGYTIPEFVRARFDGNALASGVVVLGALFGSLIEVIINIKGTSLVVSNVFGVDPRLAAIIGLVVVLIYSMLGGLWASITTSALSTLL